MKVEKLHPVSSHYYSKSDDDLLGSVNGNLQEKELARVSFMNRAVLLGVIRAPTRPAKTLRSRCTLHSRHSCVLVLRSLPFKLSYDYSFFSLFSVILLF